MRPYEPPPKPKYDIIYYSGNELPRTEDVGGAESGRSGRSGGREAHHPTQTIRVARGSTLRETVADAPKLDLPKSNSAVANLLALKALPGPAPAEGMRSSLRAPVLTQTAVAPAPQVADQLRAAPQHERGSRSAQRRGAAARSLHSSPSRIECGASGSAAGLGSGADDESESAAHHAGAERRRAAAHHDSGGGDAWDLASGPANLQKQIVPPPVQVGRCTRLNAATSAAWAALRSCLPRSSWAQVRRSVPWPVDWEAARRRPLSRHLLRYRAEVHSPAKAEAIAALGLGGPLDAGVAAAPPSSNGGGSTSGVVVSSQPGSKVGLPGSGGSGALAMSPSGGDKAGLGGSGGGGGIGRGDGPGSGFSGPGAGAGKEGTGPGSDPMARGGISPYPGSGGAGTGTSGTPAMPGVSVKGGSSNIVTLPSFGSGGKAGRGARDVPTPVPKIAGLISRSSPLRVQAAHSISTAS